jgi:type IV pilus assembly protein PilN
MRISINLATRPYVELRPLYQRLRLWMLVLGLVAASLWYVWHREQSAAAMATARVNALNNNVSRLEQREQNYRALMQQPQNAATLQESDLLNSLFKRKAFSWTATMEDLENVLPGGVQVISLEPLVSPNGHVVIRLRVSGPRDLGVALIRNLEKSKYFVAPRLASESLATQSGQPGAPAAMNMSGPQDVNFDIVADYRSLPRSRAEHKALVADETPAKRSTR